MSRPVVKKTSKVTTRKIIRIGDKKPDIVDRRRPARKKK